MPRKERRSKGSRKDNADDETSAGVEGNVDVSADESSTPAKSSKKEKTSSSGKKSTEAEVTSASASSSSADLFKDGIYSSRYPDVDIPTDMSFSQFVLNKAKEYGERDALVDATTNRSLSYLAVIGASRKVAQGLVEKGLKKGDSLLIFSPNCPEYSLAFHGTILANGIVSLANPLYTDEELSHQLKDSKARFIVTIPMFVDKVVSAAKLAGDNVDEIFVLGDAPEGTTSFAALLANDGGSVPEFLGTVDDTAVLPYSSGTTGLPKGVELTHRNLIANLLQIKAVENQISPDDVLLGLLPMFHIYGMLLILNGGLFLGTKVVTLPKFEPEAFLTAIMTHKLTVLHLVPPIILFLAKHPVIDKFDLSSVRLLFCGAAPLGKDLSAAASARLGARVKQGYGMTETSPVTHINPDDEIIDGSVGVLVPNMQARIVGVEDGTNQSPGEENTGELWVRGPNVMKGYLNNEEATRTTVDADGWLHTGDIGYANEQGHFFIVDRLKELIKYKGYQVPPAELEALLLTHPSIADAAVIGVPDEEAGELPRAYIVLKPEQTSSEAEVQAFVEGHVAPHKKLRGGVEFVSEIPKSASGKILRRHLKAKLSATKEPEHVKEPEASDEDVQDPEASDGDADQPAKSAEESGSDAPLEESGTGTADDASASAGSSEDETPAVADVSTNQTAVLRSKLRQQASQRITPVSRAKPENPQWDDWERDPANAVPWFAERECLLLVLEARMLLKEMILAKLKAERTARGNLSIGEIRDLLNSQKEESETDWIAEIQELKRALVSEVRGNHVLERDLAKLDKRIALLIKNRGDITKDIGGSKKSKKKVSANENSILSDPRKLEGYEQLFYLLQTEPRYLARMVFSMSPKEMTSFLDTVILTLFGASYSPREEFLLLRLFQQAIENEMSSCKKAEQFIQADSVVPKMLVTYIRRQQGTEFLRKLIGPVIKDILSREVVLELKPVEVYKALISAEEVATGQKTKRDYGLSEKQILRLDEIQTMLKERQATLIDICDGIVDKVLRDLKKVPYGIRWICKTIRALAEEQFPDNSETEHLRIVSYFAYYRFFNVAIVDPQSLDLVDDQPDMNDLKNLGLIGRVLQTLFNFKSFTSANDKAYFFCNEWIERRTGEIRDYFLDLLEVDEPEEYLRVDRYMELTQQAKPVIMITTDEIALTHHHLAQNLDKIAKEKHDPLRAILTELGPAPKVDEIEEREIQLTLTNKYKQELEEDVSASAALYAETKEQVIHLLRQVPLDEAAQSQQGDEELGLTQILDFARGWAKGMGNNALISDVKKITKNLASLEEEQFVSKADSYAGFLRDVALEVANRAEIREQQRKEIKRLTQTLRNLRKHHRYLEERIAHYEAYLSECRQRHFQPKSKKAKAEASKTHDFSYKELEKKGIIVDSSVPTLMRGKTNFKISANPDSFGSFDVTCHVGPVKTTLTLELDDLLERNYNNIPCVDLDDVSLDVNMTIALINKLFVGGKK